jgi:two-component system response regulator DesR
MTSTVAGQSSGMGVNCMADIDVVIADDQPLSLIGMRSAVADQGDIRILAECDNQQLLVAAVRSHPPDVLLVSAEILDDELGAVKQLISHTRKKTRVIVVTSHRDPGFLDGALQCGAKWVIHTEGPVEEIPTAIRKVTSGGVWHERAAA